jgi:hypothetical protein
MCLGKAIKKKQDQAKKQKSKSAPSQGLSAEELFLKSLPSLPKAPGEPQPPVALPQPVGSPTGGAVLQKNQTQKASRQKAAVGLDALMINLAGDVRT